MDWKGREQSQNVEDAAEAVAAAVVAAVVAKRRAYSALSWFWSAHITA